MSTSITISYIDHLVYLAPYSRIACFHFCKQLKQSCTPKPHKAEVRDKGPSSKKTLYVQAWLKGRDWGGGGSESEWWGERAKLSSPLSSLQFSCHWAFCLSPLGLSHKKRIFPFLFSPLARFYLFDFTPCRPKRPLPRVQNGSGLFCSEAHSHSKPWKGLFDDAGSVLMRVFSVNGNLRFGHFWVLLTLWETDCLHRHLTCTQEWKNGDSGALLRLTFCPKTSRFRMLSTTQHPSLFYLLTGEPNADPEDKDCLILKYIHSINSILQVPPVFTLLSGH